MTSLAGKIVFITGGASGIGLGMAKVFAEHNMRLALADIDFTRLQQVTKELNAEVLPIHLDVTDRTSWATAKKAVYERFGQVDILCNNAGIAPDGNPLAEMSPASFDLMIRINLTGVFNGINTFAADMRDRGTGHIINTASMAGLMATPRLGAYNAAKFAVVGMSEALRAEMKEHGIGVTVFCPGLVASRLVETTQAQGGEVPTSLSASKSQNVLDADSAARIVVKAMLNNQLYATTHPEYRPFVEQRMTEILSAFENGEPSSD